jgi:hypothetical protein
MVHTLTRIFRYSTLLFIEIAGKQSPLTTSSNEIAEAVKRDSATMKLITRATFNDSSSMKTIAVMTLDFLPGTFICVSSSISTYYRFANDNWQQAFFIMIMFNWNTGPDGTVVSSYVEQIGVSDLMYEEYELID